MVIDPLTGRGRAYRAPAGQGSWALHDLGDGRVVMGTFYDGRFLLFDMAKRRFVGAVAFPGESYIWNLARGKDGRIYGGTYPGGKLGALDPNTLRVEDCGAPAPPNMYLRHVSRLPDGRILCSFASTKPTTLIYDPASEKFISPPATLEGVTRGAVWNGFFVTGRTVLEGRTLQPVPTLPFPLPIESAAWSIDVNLTTENTLWFWVGSSLYRYRRSYERPEHFATVRVPGGRCLAASEEGLVAGVRGQEYFIVRQGATAAELRRIPPEPGPRPPLFLRSDGYGRLWGGPHFGQTLFWCDTKTHRFTNTLTVSDQGGEVYDVAFRDGVVFAASYSGGEIIRYDPRAPWNQMEHVNPRTIAEVGSKGYIRPTGGIVLGQDGKLYSGWMANYGQYGGAVAITDSETGATTLMENPLGEQAITGVMVCDNLLFLGTSLSANGLPDKRGEWARFGVYDLTGGKLVHREELDGVSTVRVLAVDRRGGSVRAVMSAGGRIGWAEPPHWHVRFEGFEQAPRLTGNCVGVISFPSSSPGQSNDWLAYGSQNDVVLLNIHTGHACVLGHFPQRVTNVAVANNRGRYARSADVFASCGAEVYRIRIAGAWQKYLTLGEREP